MQYSFRWIWCSNKWFYYSSSSRYFNKLLLDNNLHSSRSRRHRQARILHSNFQLRLRAIKISQICRPSYKNWITSFRKTNNLLIVRLIIRAILQITTNPTIWKSLRFWRIKLLSKEWVVSVQISDLMSGKKLSARKNSSWLTQSKCAKLLNLLQSPDYHSRRSLHLEIKL